MDPAARQDRELPALSLPGQAVWAAVARMMDAAARVASVLDPPFLRRLIGGVGPEHRRAVVAASFEESAAVRRTLTAAARTAAEQSDGLKAMAAVGGHGAEAAAAAASQADALIGTCERLREIVDRWRSAAIDHQDGKLDAPDRLLALSRRFRDVGRAIATPASGLSLQNVGHRAR